jgi:hypothetical protein
VDDFIGRQTSADDVELQHFRQLLLVAQQRVQVALAQPPEGFVGRCQQGQLAGSGDVLHEIGGVVLHNAVELVEDAVALLLYGHRSNGARKEQNQSDKEKFVPLKFPTANGTLWEDEKGHQREKNDNFLFFSLSSVSSNVCMCVKWPLDGILGCYGEAKELEREKSLMRKCECFVE